MRHLPLPTTLLGLTLGLAACSSTPEPPPPPPPPPPAEAIPHTAALEMQSPPPAPELQPPANCPGSQRDEGVGPVANRTEQEQAEAARCARRPPEDDTGTVER